MQCWQPTHFSLIHRTLIENNRKCIFKWKATRHTHASTHPKSSENCELEYRFRSRRKNLLSININSVVRIYEFNIRFQCGIVRMSYQNRFECMLCVVRCLQQWYLVPCVSGSCYIKICAYIRKGEIIMYKKATITRKGANAWSRLKCKRMCFCRFPSSVPALLSTVLPRSESIVQCNVLHRIWLWIFVEEQKRVTHETISSHIIEP